MRSEQRNTTACNGSSAATSLPEIGLGIGGVALALAITAVGMKVLRFLPESLADEAVDPHHAARAEAPRPGVA